MSAEVTMPESSLDFFNRLLGCRLVEPSGDALGDAQRALSSGHRMAKGGPPQRIASGWAVLTEAGATMQFKLAAEGITYSEATRYEAWLDCLEAFDGRPVMLLEFDKKPIPAGNLARTLDLRHVVICGPKGMEVFDWTAEPDPATGSRTHKVLWRLKADRAKASGAARSQVTA
ncbi:hypothetical protein NYO99_15810 [Pelomonas sp. UHG3]|uniref:Uncharacterized protein n=1 Tax=Roseateles hydrophilus TaxID=2975054 RepID=A0ACC6CDL1_9BURK|nr:hypothetical protein [Pelomonas sp. UHG3]MCY4746449.1 hypothetical protein [Pelomonas sp. UHG3]